MYLPKQFEETRVAVLHELIRAHPLGALVTLTPGGIEANHIPFEVDPEPAPLGTLRGHIARANPLWRDFSPDAPALAIFQGPDAYISPSWYATKKITGKVVPTWNYAVVHARGVLRFIDDRDWLRAFVEKLTHRHETRRRAPWKVSNA
jgi:transcriptional regulator